MWITVCCRSAVWEKPHFWKTRSIWSWQDLRGRFHILKLDIFILENDHISSRLLTRNKCGTCYLYCVKVSVRNDCLVTFCIDFSSPCCLSSSPPICLSACHSFTHSCEWRDDTKKENAHTHRSGTACRMVWAADISLQAICQSELDALTRTHTLIHTHSYMQILSANEGFFSLARFTRSSTRVRGILIT